MGATLPYVAILTYSNVAQPTTCYIYLTYVPWERRYHMSQFRRHEGIAMGVKKKCQFIFIFLIFLNFATRKF
jgi:hypothetical protein